MLLDWYEARFMGEWSNFIIGKNNMSEFQVAGFIIYYVTILNCKLVDHKVGTI